MGRARRRLSVALATAACLGLLAAPPAHGEFPDAASVSGSLDYWLRDRTRAGFDPASGQDTPRQTNIRQATGHLGLNFASGWLAGRLRLDLGVYATWDNLNQGLPNHEMNFWHVDNPYDQRPRDEGCPAAGSPACTRDGIALSRAAVGLRLGEHLLLRGGLLQPEAPGTLGLNRSFAPAYYRGVEIAYRQAGWEFGLLHADRYKAPWFADDYAFRRSSGGAAGQLTSLGLRLRPAPELTLDAGHAWLSDGPRRNTHFKAYLGNEARGAAAMLFHVLDPEVYRGPAALFLVQLRQQAGPYRLRAEGSYVRARAREANVVGNFVYRMTRQFGASAGNFDAWWNNRSDFNHDRELAGFVSVDRDLGDLGLDGMRAGVSCAAGYAPSPLAGVDDLREYACSLFASQAFRVGERHSATLSLHLTRYVNKTRVADWNPYTNLFQDEVDLKLWLSLPFGG